MDMYENIDEEDFVIRVRPSVNKHEWPGEIDISIISSADNPLDDESYGQLLHFVKMMCATVPIMESDEAFRDVVHQYVMEVVDEDTEPMVQENDTLVVTGEDGNVVHLNFNTKTGGSA